MFRATAAESFIRNEIRTSDLEDTEQCLKDIHRHDKRLKSDANRKRNFVDIPTSSEPRKLSVNNLKQNNFLKY